MERVRRALSLVVVLGGVVPVITGCQGMGGGGGGMLMKLVLSVGLAVGTYYLVEALK